MKKEEVLEKIKAFFKEEAKETKMSEIPLKDETVLFLDEETGLLHYNDELANGEFILIDDTVLVVADGIVQEEVIPEEESDHVEEEMAALNATIETLTAELSTLKEGNQKMSTENAELSELNVTMSKEIEALKSAPAVEEVKMKKALRKSEGNSTNFERYANIRSGK